MSKGSARRRENTALVEANWPWGKDGERKPTAPPVLNGQVEADTRLGVEQGAAVQDVHAARQGDPSNSV